MKIRELNQIVNIEENQTEVDSDFNHLSKWVPYFTCHAKVTQKGGLQKDEKQANGKTVTHQSTEIVLRASEKTRKIHPKTHRVIFNGETFNIRSVISDFEKNKSVTLNCEGV